MAPYVVMPEEFIKISLETAAYYEKFEIET